MLSHTVRVAPDTAVQTGTDALNVVGFAKNNYKRLGSVGNDDYVQTMIMLIQITYFTTALTVYSLKHIASESTDPLTHKHSSFNRLEQCHTCYNNRCQKKKVQAQVQGKPPPRETQRRVYLVRTRTPNEGPSDLERSNSPPSPHLCASFLSFAPLENARSPARLVPNRAVPSAAVPHKTQTPRTDRAASNLRSP
jgi:hypothetical protein